MEKITYPRTCGLCHHTYKNCPGFSRHRKDCKRFQEAIDVIPVKLKDTIESTVTPVPNQTIIYQTVINVLNYNVFPNEAPATNKALFGDITAKQRRQINNVTSILAKDGIEGLRKTTEFIQTKFRTLEELEGVINQCDIQILGAGIQIDYEGYYSAEQLYNDAKSSGKEKKIKKAEVKLNAAIDKCLESAIYYVFQKIVLNHNTGDCIITSESLANSPPIFVNSKGEVEAWTSEEGIDVRRWLSMQPQNTWAKVGHCIANRITQAAQKQYPSLHARYREQKDSGVPFSKSLIRKLRKDLEEVCQTDTANGWHEMTKRCNVSDKQIAISEVSPVIDDDAKKEPE